MGRAVGRPGGLAPSAHVIVSLQKDPWIRSSLSTPGDIDRSFGAI